MQNIIFNATLMDETLTGIGRYQWNVLMEMAKNQSLNIIILLNKDFTLSSIGQDFLKKMRELNKNVQIRATSSSKVIYRLKSLLGLYTEKEFVYHDLSFNSVFWDRGICNIVTFHDAFFLDDTYNSKVGRLGRLNAKIFLPWSAKKADHLVVQTKVVKEQLVKGLDLDPQKISVFPMGNPFGSELKNFNQDRKVNKSLLINGKEITKPFFLVVGAGNQRKRTGDAIKASQLIDKAHQLVIVGKNALDEPSVQESLNNNENVIILGYVTNNELMDLYNNCLGLVFPSSEEGFGFPIIEGLSFNVPILATDIEVFKEVGGHFIHTFPVGDVKALSKLMENVLVHNLPSNNLSEVQNWLSQFTWENYCEQLTKLYKRY